MDGLAQLLEEIGHEHPFELLGRFLGTGAGGLGLDHQVLGQALREQEADSPQHPDRGQEHLVDAAPGQDERNVDRGQGTEVGRKAGGMGQRQAPGPGSPTRDRSPSPAGP